jgi:hypothetical protein
VTPAGACATGKYGGVVTDPLAVGGLTPVTTFASAAMGSLTNPMDAAFLPPNGDIVYVVGGGSGSVSWFSRSADKRSLTYQDKTSIYQARAIATSYDGKNVYVTVEGGSNCGIWWYVNLGGSEVGASKKDIVLR